MREPDKGSPRENPPRQPSRCAFRFGRLGRHAPFLSVLVSLALGGSAAAQGAGSIDPATEGAPPSAARSIVHLSAKLAAGDTQPVPSGVQWRIFDEAAGSDGTHRLVAQSSEATPALTLQTGPSSSMPASVSRVR